MEKNELLEMAKNLIVIAEPAGRLATAVKEASRVIGCQRCCLILLVGQNDLIIAQGTPEADHGLGQKITDQYGRKFLFGVLEQNLPVIVANAKTDRRTQYMKDIIRDYQIMSVLYLPLFYQRKPLGLLVFDAISDEEKHKFSKENISKINALAELVAAAVAGEQASKIRKEEQLRQEKLTMLGQQSAVIMHSLRNQFTQIGLATRQIYRNLSRHQELTKKIEATENLSVSCQELKELADRAQITYQAVMKIEDILNHGLQFLGFSAKNLKISQADLDGFLQTTIKKFKERYSRLPVNQRFGLRIATDKHLEKIKLPFDPDALEICLNDILQNAVEALATKETGQAKKILVKSQLETQVKKVVITIANNEKIDPHIAEEIFSPFFTTKPDGTGLGLSIAQTIIQAHGGEIKLITGPWTQFKIILPLG